MRFSSAFSILGLASFVVSSSFVACSEPEVGNDDGVGAAGGDLNDEPSGVGTRSSASLLLRGEGFGELSSTYAGDYASDGSAPEYVHCSYGNDPDDTGSRRLQVVLGHTDRPPVVEFVLKRWSELGPATSNFDFDGGLSEQALAVTIRRALSGGEQVTYEYAGHTFSGTKTHCRVELIEFSRLQLAGSVACRDLIDVATADGSEPDTVSSTVTFECPLQTNGLDSSPNPGDDDCTDAATQACTGANDCTGSQTCSGGAWSDCSCAPIEPSLLFKLVPAAAEYEGRVEQTTGSGLASLAAAMASDGYVVTSGTANTVPYTLFGVRPKGSEVVYETSMEQTNGNGLATAASSMAAAGYVPMVGMANTVPYTLIGVRPKNSVVEYETTMQQTTGSGLLGVLTTMAADGYVPLVAMANSTPYTIIGVRRKGSSKKYVATMEQTTGAGLTASANGLVSGGYVITAAMANTVPFTLIGVKEVGVTSSLSAHVEQTIGAGLSSLMTSMSGSGFVVLTATGPSSPYTFFGTRLDD